MKNRIYLALLLIIGAHTFLLKKLMFFPYPELFIYPYLTNNGLVPYKEIFDQHFPGLMFLPVNLNNLGMVNEDIARWWLIGIVVLTHLLLFFISKSIFKNWKPALLVNLLYLVWQPFFEGYVLWIDSFMPLLLLPAFYFTYLSLATNKLFYRLSPIFLAGLFLGLGLLFKQVTGPIIAAVFLLLIYNSPKIKTATLFLLGVMPIPLLTTLYYLSLGIIKDVWFWTVVFNLTTFAEHGRKSPFFTGVVRVVGVYGISILLSLITDRKLAVSLAVYILGGLIFAFARFDFVHLQPSIPFVVIATVVVFEKIKKNNWGKLIILGYIAMTLWWSSIFYQGHLSDKVWFFDSETKSVSDKIRSLTTPNERIFLFGPVLHLYQMSNTLPTGNIFVFQFPWFMMETEDLFLEALKDEPPELVLRDRSVIIEGHPITEFSSKLDSYIDKEYETFERIGETEFMRLKNER